MNLDHLVFIVLENRSFDHYFGTFPGADGIPMDANDRPKVCLPDPEQGGCHRPYHDSNFIDQGGPHGEVGSEISINGGAMDGFVEARRVIGNGCDKHPDEKPCPQAVDGPQGQPDVMGYHTAKEPIYWEYAKTFTLHDDVRADRFVDPAGAPVPDLGLVGHLQRPTTRCRARRTRSSPAASTPTSPRRSGRRRWRTRPYVWARSPGSTRPA